MRRSWLLSAAMAAALGAAAASCQVHVPLGAGAHVGPKAPRPPAPAEGTAAEAGRGETPPPAPAPAAPVVPPTGSIEVSVTGAILMALENNQELAVQRANPEIVRTFEQEAASVFDPVIRGDIAASRVREETVRRNYQGRRLEDTRNRLGGAEVATLLPTGTAVALGASTDVEDRSTRDRLVGTRFGLTVTQALLRGFGQEVNLASVRQARIDTLASEYELRGFAESLVALVEQTYWDHALACRQVRILTEGITQAEQQVQAVQDRVSAGASASIDLAAVEAEVARRRQDLVQTRSDIEKTRLLLLRLLNPRGPDVWSRELRLGDLPDAAREQPDDVEAHVQVAVRMRPDLNQARLGVQRGDLEILKTRNGLLPRLDLFITFGRTLYSDSFTRSMGNPDAYGWDVFAGLSAEYPLKNRFATAQHERAVATRRQAVEAVTNLAQLVQLDVRTAYVEVRRAEAEILAATETRRLDEVKLRAEVEKFTVGRASSFQVARAQRDLVDSRLAEVEAVADYLKALVELYRLEGSLLERRGISAPGRDPVDIPATSP